MLLIKIEGNWHHKNKNGFSLLNKYNIIECNVTGMINFKYANLNKLPIVIFKHDIDMPIINLQNINLKIFIISGPHVDFKQALDFFNNYKSGPLIIYNALSPWQKNLFETYAPNPLVKYITLPFCVDVDKFKPLENIKKNNTFFIYYKNRDVNILNFIENIAKQLAGFAHIIFIYGKYNEQTYLEHLRKSMFGIWIGCHESQGFALQEALSCNCPLFVYDVKTLKDEIMQNGHIPWNYLNGVYPATSASYFDNRCGMIINNLENFEINLKDFITKVNNGDYKPREYILENFTENSFISRLENIITEL